VLLALGVTVAVLLLHSPGNVSHPNLSFTQPTATVTTPAPAAKPAHRATVDNFVWPRYGFDAARTRDAPGGPGLHPPFRQGWSYSPNGLIEFPPVIYHGYLYFVDDGGTVKEINKTTGRRVWFNDLGSLAAASPAVGVRERMIYVPILSTHGHSPGGGEIAGLSLYNGHVVWSKPIPAGTESSPIVWKRTLYFGDQAGNVYSIDARTGHVYWTYHASAAVKGGPALANGILYFGDYAGRAYALNATSGRQIWAVSTNGAHFGFGSGNFYSTPAVAFGRVYMGNTDGRVYSFAARTGQLAWATSTGAYVYGSPAVAEIPGLGPTVYVGSYDGNFYAFNAQSGAIRWRHAAGGRISGSATIVNGVVYFSDLGTKTTTGLDARTGRRVFFFGDGAFNPVIADTGAVYMIGYHTIYQMLPRSRPGGAAAAGAATHRGARSRSRTRQVRRATRRAHRTARRAHRTVRRHARRRRRSG
jgi:outer membrane protein assembly factor BamB